MRKFGTLLVAAAALAFASGIAAAQTPKKGGELVFAISAETPYYDCQRSETYATLHFASPFYSTLIQFDLANFHKLKGDLAKSALTAAGFDSDQSFMLVEVAGKELSFQAISRTGQTVDKGTILMHEAVRTTAAAGVPPAAPQRSR